MNQQDATTGRRETAGPPRVGELVTSVRNQRVVDVARLHRRRDRRATSTYLVEGPNAVGEVLAEGDVEVVFCVEERVDDYRDVGVEVVPVQEHVLERLADSRSPQGVVAVARIRATALGEVLTPGRLLVVLDSPSDPGNLGAVIRTADAAGADAVVVAGDAVDPWNPKVVRATTGSLVHVPIVVDVATDEVLRAAGEAGWYRVALDMDGDGSVFDLERDDRPVAVVLGNEAHGLAAEVHAAVDAVLAVPSFGRAESLNLAAAAAVTMYAAARGRT